jgi:two-component system response regulator PilR (NtrC family)
MYIQTMESPGRILVIDDDPSLCELLKISLKREGHNVSVFSNPVEGLANFEKSEFDVVIQDIKMPQMDGIDLLKKLKSHKPDTPVVIITAFSTWDRAVQAMRLGAYDYIRKPFDMSMDIKSTIKRALNVKERHGMMMQSAEEILEKLGFVIGYSRQMKMVWDLVRKAAQTDSTCLIQGESGVGKELVAKALHYLSARANKQFTAINCGAIPEQLLESELFGHMRGAFTDAVQDRPGLIELSNNGTVFLDEISEMSPALQVKLLRLLEEREYRPVGGSLAKRADVRFITATNKELGGEVDKGTFRQDLFFRLNVIPIRVPPLRERPEDIPILGEYFLRKYARQMNRPIRTFSEDAKGALQSYYWPGNVRELENLVQRAVALAEGDHIDVADLFDAIQPKRAPSSADQQELPQEGISLDEKVKTLEMHYLKEAMEKSGGNYTRAAQLLGMSLSSLRYKLQKYGLVK